MTTRVLIVDDERPMRVMLRRALEVDGFEVVGEAGDGRAGAELAVELTPDVALVDMNMPGHDGVAMLRALRESGVTTRVLMFTANSERAAITSAIAAGADGYVLKGSRPEEIRTAIRNVRAGGSALAPQVARSVLDDYTRVLEERRARDLAVITTLAGAVEARDQGTGDHAQNVTRLSTALWRSLTGEDPIDDLHYGFLLHDVGKISIPDAVLLKPGPLHADEIAVMRGHVDIGVAIVDPLGFRPEVLEVIRCHHERFDGSGYPRGLRGDQIPMAARMFSIADAYDAMTRDRPYRKALSVADSVAELERCAGTHFDPDCVRAFVTMLREAGLAA